MRQLSNSVIHSVYFQQTPSVAVNRENHPEHPMTEITEIQVHNPSLRQEPRDKPASVLQVRRQASILDWLEQAGRLRARQPGDFDYVDDEEEINDLMGNDTDDYEEEDDDDVGDVDD
jgi:Protein of unknown function (DUF3134)